MHGEVPADEPACRAQVGECSIRWSKAGRDLERKIPGLMDVRTTPAWELETSNLILLGHSFCPKHQHSPVPCSDVTRCVRVMCISIILLLWLWKLLEELCFGSASGRFVTVLSSWEVYLGFWFQRMWVLCSFEKGYPNQSGMQIMKCFEGRRE